jgi:predicted RNA binding protein YcfA (HicA-like mRNA interferase family)
MAGIALNQRQFEKLLKENGYKYDRQSGDHRIWIKDGYNHISFNIRKLNPIVVQRLIKENELNF